MKEFTEYIKSGENGHLYVEGKDCVELANEYGTPLFVISENQLRANIRRFRKAFESKYPEKITFCIGIKANNGLAVRRVIATEGAGGDAFGLGELYSAMIVGTDPNNIGMNGCNKLPEVIEAAIDAGITINVDSLDELRKVIIVGESINKKANITLRMRLPLEGLMGKLFIDPRYGPPGTDVGLWERTFKFGMEPKQIFEAYEIASKSKAINLRGLMYHGGIPRRAGYYVEEVHEVLGYVKYMKETYGWEPEMLNFGGGFTSERYGTKKPDAIEDVAEYICNAIIKSADELNLNVPQLVVEPGRWCIESAIIFLSQVGCIKTDNELTDKTWVYVDANINEREDPFDPHQKYHELVLCNNVEAEREITADICGQLCNAADILVEKRFMPKVKDGDILAMLDMGAYNESFANQANAMPRSASVMINGDKVAVVRRRETTQDIFARDIVPYWLL